MPADWYSKLAECMGCTPEEVPTLIQQHAPWNGKAVCDDALRERAAVVTWLRSRGMADYAQSNLDYAATMIERGEHRREEKP